MPKSQSDSTTAATTPSRFTVRLFKRLLLLCCTLLVLAIVLEVGVRLFTDTVPPLLVKDPKIGKRYQQSFDMTVYEPEAQRDIRMRFNRVGFRGPDRPYEKPPGVRRIAVLGDSMIASLAVDEQDTLVAQLESRLNQSASDVMWEVLNFGVSGSSPAQEITLYRELVRRFDVDIVLCAFFVGNDLADNCSRLSKNRRIYFDFDDAGQLNQLPFSESHAFFSRLLNRYSRFYVWQKHATMRAISRARSQLQVIPPGRWIFCERNQPEDVAYAWRLTEAVVKLLQQEVTGDGGQFAMVMLPASEQVYSDLFEELAATDPDHRSSFDWDFPDRRMAEICAGRGVPLLTMTTEFRAATPTSSSKKTREWLFHDGIGHFNEAGNKLAAVAVHRFLTQPNVQISKTESMVHLVR